MIESWSVTVPKTSGDQRVDIPGKRDHQIYTPSLQLSPQRFGRWKEIERLATRTRLAEEVFIPGRIQAHGRKEKEYKKLAAF